VSLLITLATAYHI